MTGRSSPPRELLHEYGIATPSPILYEPDRGWIGSKFLVMPRIVGHTPSDTSYATPGWLAEADFAWWLATRKQMLEVNRIDADPELPGFDSRDDVIGRFENMIGRSLENLDWYEIFAMVRMGCCILRTQVLLRSNGQADHFLTKAPILPAWTIEAVRS